MKKVNKRVLSLFLALALSVTPLVSYADELSETAAAETVAVEEALELTKDDQSLEEIIKAYYDEDLTACDAVKTLKIVSAEACTLDAKDCQYIAENFKNLEKLDVREAAFADQAAYDYFLIKDAEETYALNFDELEYLYTEDAEYAETEAVETEAVETEAVETETAETETAETEAAETEEVKVEETEAEAPELASAKVTADSVTQGTSDTAKGIYEIKVNNCKGSVKGSLTAPVKQVTIAVWPKSAGVNARKVYSATLSGSSWSAKVSLADFGYKAGDYEVQAYGTDGYGVHNYVGGLSFTAAAPSTNIMTKVISADQTTVKVTLSNAVIPADTRYVAVVAWGAKNAKNDIKWYTASKNAAGNYEVTIKTANHKEYGLYYAQFYAIGKTVNTRLAADTYEITPTTGRLGFARKDPAKGTFSLCAAGLNCPATVTGVNFVVYSVVDGNKDQKIYKAVKSGDTWQASVDIANHNADLGNYAIYAYASDARGISTCFGQMVYNVVAPTVKPTMKVVVSDTTANVVVTVNDLLGAKDVCIPVWGDKNGQNDIKYYTATTKDNRNWTLTFSLTNHLELGKYHAYVYATIGGTRAARCSTTFNVDKIAENLVYISDKNPESGTYKINIVNPTGLANMDDILVATWSNKDGQDDIHYVKMVKGAKNTWSATINPADHDYEKGIYVNHVILCNPAGQRQYVGKATTDVQFTAKYGFVTEGGKTYYYIRLNEKAKGELRLKGYRYYFDTQTGEMAVGWKYINGLKFYFDKEGHMVQDVWDILGLQSSYYLELNRILNCMVLYAWNPETGSYSIPVKAFRTSTGDATPLGTWTLKETFKWMGMYNGTFGQYTVQIVGPYFLHSVCYERFGDNYSLMPLGYNALGVNKSAGCVRLRVIDAKLLYDLKNAGLLTTIHIFDGSSYGPFDWPYYGTIPDTQTWEPSDPEVVHR